MIHILDPAIPISSLQFSPPRSTQAMAWGGIPGFGQLAQPDYAAILLQLSSGHFFIVSGTPGS